MLSKIITIVWGLLISKLPKIIVSRFANTVNQV